MAEQEGKKWKEKCLEGKSYETHRMFQKRHWRKNPETALRPIELLMREKTTKELPAPWFSRGEKP